MERGIYAASTFICIATSKRPEGRAPNLPARLVPDDFGCFLQSNGMPALRGFSFLRFPAEGPAQAIPQIDHADGGGEIHEFLFGEMFFYLVVHVVGGAGLGDVS